MNKPTAQQQNKKRPLIVQEPLEILKAASEQIGLREAPPSEEDNNHAKLEQEQVMKAKDTAQGERQITALENEIKDIQKQKEVTKQQEVQRELIAKQQAPTEIAQPISLAKRGRKLIGGIVGKFKKQNQQFVETRKPPSS
jgi:hypothetical protein